ncbi:hypothetical protein N431DRAFT_489432 [Stipitochalara longipes BDJ]|nr:hypothetical protein N431DRAFT_489432 [Stipitochalara longipes BDJ]
MLTLIQTAALMTVTLSSLSFTAPTTRFPAASQSTSATILLDPISSSDLTPEELNSFAERAAIPSSSPSAAPVIILSPISESEFPSDLETMRALVNATMKHPSILLEDISSIKTVDCSANSVDMVWNSAVDYQQSRDTWPKSTFILLTNHQGDCDTDNERGLYVVDSLTFSNDTLTITAATTKSTFDNSTDEMEIAFTKPVPATTKLGVEVMVSGEVDISADLSATIEGGSAHLDLLDSKNTVTSGWTPVYTNQTNISVAAEAQFNPFVELTAEIRVSFLGGKLDLSTGVTARPELINAFDVKMSFDISNSAMLCFPPRRTLIV